MRAYRPSDMPLLQSTVAAWIAEAGRWGYDHIGELPHRVHENLRGRDLSRLVHLWDADGLLSGITIAGRFGNAFDCFVAPSHRGTAFETALLSFACETTRRASGAAEILTDGFDRDTVRAELLTGLGFERFRTWDDIRERDLTDLPTGTTAEGFTIRSARPTDAAALAEARNRSFEGAGWTASAYAEFMRAPGYDPAREIVAEAPDGRIAAYTVYWTDERNRLGHFEPVGTHEDFRRLGLAAAVMRHAMTEMRAQGITRATVNHNAENLAARGLYERLGFAREYATYGYRKIIGR
ncbi:mycothiol acetyltransferase [Actinorhabdospora filicis]|uniref:Mycothiol acetyltransferase n=1 Tax=Actinorhabdospora filicis TaxID=1785913 RepID=A0A9W6SHF8_9ACTN|nr:GNAT family N-acetyltransferase [Actinorhabdospora filicis]GLZ76353.1 mycothiol acetyltransferase [Actinorhabdospora filicis]